MRPASLTDPTVYYDDKVLLTRQSAWTWTEVPPVPYAFTDQARRVSLGWLATMSLGALREGPVTMKVVHQPVPVAAATRARDEAARAAGHPRRSWPDYLTGEQRRVVEVGGTAKHVYLGHRIGQRSMTRQLVTAARREPVPPVLDHEVTRWGAEADRVRGVLARGGYRAHGLDADGLRGLRRHALWRGVTPPPPTGTGRRAWGVGEVADEFTDVEVLPGRRGVRVDSPTGTVWTATFVASVFPIEMSFPDVEPWAAHADALPFLAEVDLMFDLVPSERARADIRKRFNLAADQRRDARRAGHDLPIETAEILAMAKELDYTIPQRRLPLAYGWARIRVDAESESELAAMYEEVRHHYAGLGSTGVDVVWPHGGAQVSLLAEGIPGMPVTHRSWRQKWLLETVGCALPHAASGLSHETGAYRGYTTGRSRQAVRWDPHAPIRARVRRGGDVEAPSGVLMLGQQRAGKSSALGSIVFDAAVEGVTTVLIDPSGPMQNLAGHPWLADRVRVIDLLGTGGGIVDPLGPALIPGQSSNPKVRTERERLARDMFTTLAWTHLRTAKDAAVAETELLRAIRDVSGHPAASALDVVKRLRSSPFPAATNLGEHLSFDIGGVEADAVFGQGTRVTSVLTPVTIIVMPGLVLPRPGTPLADMMPAEAMGSALFALGAHLGRRLLWGMAKDRMKVFAVDEAHVPLGTDSGRRAIEGALRDGPKHGVATVLATHNTADVDDERLLNAISTRFQFRSTDPTELSRLLRVNRIEDTAANRQAVTSLANGECLAVFPSDVRDRFQWDLWVPGLRDVLNTTPTGVEAAV